MGAAEIMTQTIVVALPALRPLLGVMKMPKILKFNQIRRRGSHAKSSRPGTTTSQANTLYYPGSIQEPGPAMLKSVDQNWELPNMNLGSSWKIEIGNPEKDPDPSFGSGWDTETGKPDENSTGRHPEPWENVELPQKWLE